MMNILNYPPTLDSPGMLDAFIIEKIQRERELHESRREQLHIEVPVEPESDPDDKPRNDKTERGIAIVDFNI